MIPFDISTQALEGLDAETVANLIGATHDVSVLLNDEGVVIDVAFGSDRPLIEDYKRWIGAPWSECVTKESVTKIEMLFEEAKQNSERRWRQVNHPIEDSADVPVLYMAFEIESAGVTVAVGKDLRPMSELQQQLLDLQHSIENDYARLQQAENRYRMLFQIASEAIIIIDPGSKRIIEVNPAAARLLNENPGKLVGRSFPRRFAPDSESAINELLADVRATGSSERITVQGRDSDEQFTLSATQLQRDNDRLYLIRIASPHDAAGAQQRSGREQHLLDVAEATPDGVVVTDHAGQITSANKAFLDMCQIASEFQVRNQPLDQWVGRPGVDVNVLRKNLKQRGFIREFATRVNVEYGSPIDVELSGVALTDEDPPSYGFVIRRVLRRADRVLTDEQQSLPQSVAHMTDLVGRVPLKDLIRETTDLIEKMCIEAALKLTNDNRASAAEMLGLSRQSLYVKLRRHDLGGSDSANDK